LPKSKIGNLKSKIANAPLAQLAEQVTLNDGGNNAKRHAVTEYATDSSDRLTQDRKIPEEIARPALGSRFSCRRNVAS
jgi:hypothetical protein